MKRRTSILLFLTAVSLLLFAHFSDARGTEKPLMARASLTGTQWWVEDIDGKGVIDASHTTLNFLEQGRVAGDSGCNRYNGSVESEGEIISFGPMAGTRMACAESLMNQEMAFYKAIGQVHKWKIEDTGLLSLLDGNGAVVVRARRIEDSEQ